MVHIFVILLGAFAQLVGEYVTNDTPTSSIYNVYIIPRKFVDQTLPTGDVFAIMADITANKNYSYQVSKPTTINGYTPKNKKLLTYPYCYLLLSNNSGSSNILMYEKFTEPTSRRYRKM